MNGPAGILRLIEERPEPGAEAGDAPLALAVPGAQMTEMQRAVDMFRVSWRRLRYGLSELWGADGGPAHVVRHGKAPSLHEQCEYAKGRNWVPPGHEGGYLERAGVLYHALIGRPGVALGLWIAGTAASPYRFIVHLSLGYLLAVTGVWWLAGEKTVAIWMIAGFAAAAVGQYLALRPRKPRPARMTGRKSKEDEK